MTVLILGLVIFFGVHAVPSTPLKTVLNKKLGEARYKIGFSLAALVGLGLIIYGFSIAPFVHLWAPLPGAKHAALTIMPLSIILLSASDLPNNLKRLVKHPMLLGILLWSSVHLAANGDMASTLIFLSFGLAAAINLVTVLFFREAVEREPVATKWDVILILVGLVGFALLAYFHGALFGMPLF